VLGIVTWFVVEFFVVMSRLDSPDPRAFYWVNGSIIAFLGAAAIAVWIRGVRRSVGGSVFVLTFLIAALGAFGLCTATIAGTQHP